MNRLRRTVNALPWALPAAHTVAVIAAVLLWAGGLYTLPGGPGGEYFTPYVYISGPIVFPLASMMADASAGAFSASLTGSPVFVSVVLTGAFCLVLGGLQYWLVGGGLALAVNDVWPPATEDFPGHASES